MAAMVTGASARSSFGPGSDTNVAAARLEARATETIDRNLIDYGAPAAAV